MKKCPNCGKISFDVNKQCSNCSYVFPAQTPINKLCLAGFLCSCLPTVIYIVHRVTDTAFNAVTLIIGWIALVSGILLSMIGLFGRNRTGFAIPGLVIGLVGIIPWFFITSLVYAFRDFDYDKAVAANTAPSTSQTEWYPHSYGIEVDGENFSVERIYDTDDPEAAALIYSYWNGDPKYSNINIPVLVEIYNNGRTTATVVSLGSSEPNLDGFSIVIKPEEKDFFKTKAYRESPKDGDITADPSSFGVKPGTEVHYEEIVFKISIDEYVKDVVIGKGYGEPGYLAVINDDKSITFWHYSYYFDVDYDNPVYYSKDGELYTKSDDKCVYPEIS